MSIKAWAKARKGGSGLFGRTDGPPKTAGERKTATRMREVNKHPGEAGTKLAVKPGSPMAKGRESESHASSMAREGIHSEAAKHYSEAAKHYTEGGHHAEAAQATDRAANARERSANGGDDRNRDDRGRFA